MILIVKNISSLTNYVVTRKRRIKLVKYYETAYFFHMYTRGRLQMKNGASRAHYLKRGKPCYERKKVKNDMVYNIKYSIHV